MRAQQQLRRGSRLGKRGEEKRALVAGLAADALGMRAAIGFVAGLTALSGLIVLVRMRETRVARPARYM